MGTAEKLELEMEVLFLCTSCLGEYPMAAFINKQCQNRFDSRHTTCNTCRKRGPRHNMTMRRLLRNLAEQEAARDKVAELRRLAKLESIFAQLRQNTNAVRPVLNAWATSHTTRRYAHSVQSRAQNEGMLE